MRCGRLRQATVSIERLARVANGLPTATAQPDFAATASITGPSISALGSAFKAWLDCSSFVRVRVASVATIATTSPLPPSRLGALSAEEPAHRC